MANKNIAEQEIHDEAYPFDEEPISNAPETNSNDTEQNVKDSVEADKAAKSSRKVSAETKRDKKKMNIYEKLAYISATMEVPKNQYSDFGNFYYRNLDSILDVAKPLCVEYNCLLYITDDIEIKGEITKQDDSGITTYPNTYIKATAHFIDCDTGNEITTCAYAKECEHPKMSADQCTGTASSYARKYCLNALFSIDDVRSSDSINNGSNRDNNSRPAANNNGGKGGGWNTSKNNSKPANNAQNNSYYDENAFPPEPPQYANKGNGNNGGNGQKTNGWNTKRSN